MKSKSQELIDKSVAAMVSGIEIYNKPDFLYRGETFAILAINSWELLLKAKYLRMNDNKMRSLYILENKHNKDGSKSKKKMLKTTRSGNPFTHSLDFIAKKMIDAQILDTLVWHNIEALIEIRDSAIHFYNYSLKFNVRIQEIGTASLKNYVAVYKQWFGKDLSSLNFYLMPLSFVAAEKENDVLNLNTEEKNFCQFLNNLEDISAGGNSEFSIALNVDIRFSKTTSKDAMKVILSKDADALKVTLTEPQIKEKYPFDYAQLTAQCKKRYREFKVNKDYHHFRSLYENDIKYAYTRYLDPSNRKGSKKIFYSNAILSRLDTHYIQK